MDSSNTNNIRTVDAGLLLLRLVLGVVMFLHGTQKLFGWFGGGGLEGTGQFFTQSGYPAGETMAAVAGIAETAGGVGLILGLLVPLAGAAVVGTMINAVALKWAGGFFSPDGVEYELLLIAAGAALVLTGPGRLSIDRALPRSVVGRPAAAVGSLALGVVAAAAVLAFRA